MEIDNNLNGEVQVNYQEQGRVITDECISISSFHRPPATPAMQV